jgi:hypothetical protein
MGSAMPRGPCCNQRHRSSACETLEQCQQQWRTRGNIATAHCPAHWRRGRRTQHHANAAVTGGARPRRSPPAHTRRHTGDHGAISSAHSVGKVRAAPPHAVLSLSARCRDACQKWTASSSGSGGSDSSRGTHDTPLNQPTPQPARLPKSPSQHHSPCRCMQHQRCGPPFAGMTVQRRRGDAAVA